MRVLRIGMAQINATVGDLAGNTRKILDCIDRARAVQADVLCFPELAITGYPPEDLLLKPSFVKDNLARLDEIVAACKGLTAVVGFVDVDGDIYNAAAVIHDGRLVSVYHKQFLPNYGVFDENRYFQSGTETPVFDLRGTLIGVNICEDIWYSAGPTTLQAAAGAEVIVNINASPYHRGKRDWRMQMLATRARDHLVYVVYTNLVGGQDELVFDGNSVVFDPEGRVIAEAGQFEEDLVFADLEVDAVMRARLRDPRRRQQQLAIDAASVRRYELPVPPAATSRPPIERARIEPLSDLAEVYSALVLGTRDYVRKTGFQKVVLGLSGGIDSSLVAAIAVDALGRENVTGVSMPSRYSSEGSKHDAWDLAERLGIRCLTIPIEPGFQGMLDTLAEALQGTEPDLTEENLQARIRGNILMALSNKFGWLVLTTGNKSEMGTGYSTLYGDMAGGFAVIKDVPKMLVYELSRYRNSLGPQPVIPESVLTKAPSAELRPNQTDQDSLPPYPVLDAILELYVEDDQSFADIVALGYDPATVQRVMRLVDVSEYKRRQAPPGVKITERAFGRDRRLPITNRYRQW